MMDLIVASEIDVEDLCEKSEELWDIGQMKYGTGQMLNSTDDAWVIQNWNGNLHILLVAKYRWEE